MGIFSWLLARPGRDGTSAPPPAAGAPPAAAAPAPTYQQLRHQGSKQLDAGDFPQALLAFEAAAQLAPEVSEAHLNLGYVLKELGRVEQAKVCFAQAIALDSRNFDAHLLSAMLATDEAANGPALESVQAALRIQPDSAEANALLIGIWAANEDLPAVEAHARQRAKADASPTDVLVEIASAAIGARSTGPHKDRLIAFAIGHLEQAIRLDPAHENAHLSLALVMMARNDMPSAIRLFSEVVRINPKSSEAQFALASCHRSQGALELAIKHAHACLATAPKHMDAHTLLGQLYSQSGDYDAAVSWVEKAIVLQPKSTHALTLLGEIHSDAAQHAKALQCGTQAAELEPNNPDVHFTLGNIYANQNNFPKAVASYRRALQLQPAHLSSLVNLGSALISAGDFAAADETMEAVLARDPGNLIALQNAAYCASFDADKSAANYLARAQRFGAAATALAHPVEPKRPRPVAGRCLKVGLVSGDFCLHPVGFFLESMLSQIDPDAVELHAISNQARNDALQISLRSRFTSWTSIVGLKDAPAADMVRAMNLDLLIDLSGHTSHNRLSLFAWRPAPVQATWLGYWASTGMKEIDYILVDPHGVPTEHQTHFTEKVWYLPQTRMCFSPPSAVFELDVAPLPALKAGFCTFGSYQPLKKLTDAVLATWGRIHKRLPNARFRLQGREFTDPRISAELLGRLRNAGIPEDLVRLHEGMPRLDYMKSHGEVDILLDSFPYPGGTTTCDALWMGVPTVTLAGQSLLARQGVSLLSCAGLADWIANDEDEYAAIAVAKASDVMALSRLRRGLRQQVFASPLFDAPLFARNLETCLRDMVNDKLGHPP